jgi:uncharacterized coiled-coil DUF342 family protein
MIRAMTAAELDEARRVANLKEYRNRTLSNLILRLVGEVERLREERDGLRAEVVEAAEGARFTTRWPGGEL